MYMRIGKHVFCFIALVVMFVSFSANGQIDRDRYQWKLKKDSSGVQVFTAKVPNSKHLAVSAVTVIDAQAESVAAMIMDLPNCSQWAPLCKKAYVQERVSATENYVYSLNNIPFPGVDRDAVTHVFWSKDEATGVISMESSAVDDNRVAKVKGVIRIKHAVAKWRLTPQANGMLLIESYAHVNPASSMPKWLLNRLLVGSPHKTMKNIRKRMEEGLYQGAQLPF